MSSRKFLKAFCYGPDGEGDPPPAQTDEGGVFDPTKVDENYTSESDKPVTLTQKQLSEMIGGVRVKLKKKLDDTSKQIEDLVSKSSATQTERDKLNEILTQSRSDYESKLENTSAQVANLQKQLATLGKEKDETVSQWKKRYESTVIDIAVARGCEDHGVYSPQQMRDMLDRNLSVVELVDPKDGKGTGEFDVIVKSKNDKGEAVNVKVAEYIKSLDDSGKHPNLFKHKLKDGLNTSGGGTSGAETDAPTEPEKLEEWLKNPENRKKFLSRKTT